MVIVFWDYRDIHEWYVVEGKKMNSETYVKTLKEVERTNQSRSSGEKADASST